MDPLITLKTGWENQFLWMQLSVSDRFLEGAKFLLSLAIVEQKKWGMARESKQVFKGLESHDSTSRPCLEDCYFNGFCTVWGKLQMSSGILSHVLNFTSFSLKSYVMVIRDQIHPHTNQSPGDWHIQGSSTHVQRGQCPVSQWWRCPRFFKLNPDHQRVYWNHKWCRK